MTAAVDAVLCARMGSSRLPGKVLLPMANRPVLQLVLERLQASARLGRVVVATSNELEDEPIAALCVALGVTLHRGSGEDVLDRVCRCAREHGMAHVAYFGADNPLIDPSLCDEIIGVYLGDLGRWDYVTNNYPPTYPDGQEVEVISLASLETAWREATDLRHREHPLAYLWEKPQRFRIRNLTHEPNLHHERWTLDFPEDYEFLRAVFEALYPANPAFGMYDVLRYLDLHPGLRQINARHRNYYPWLAAYAARVAPAHSAAGEGCNEE